MLQAFADDPEEVGGEHPDGGGTDYDQRWSVADDELLYCYCEDQEPQASDGCSGGVDRHCFAGLDLAVDAGLLLPFSFVLFNQSCTGWEDGGECKEESADRRAVGLRDNAGRSRYRPAKHETQQELMPGRGFERRCVDFDSHDVT